MKIRDICQFIESIAPPAYQESYDNSGLIVGDPNTPCTGVLLTLDSLEATIDEAIEKGCNLIVAHHPIVFRGLKKFNGKNYVERIVIKAIQKNIAIFAAHTNLDNVHTGVNQKICDTIGLQNTRILAPKTGLLKKLYTFCPIDHADKIRAALFQSGAGQIGNYEECSYHVDGFGTFKAGEKTKAFVGEKDSLHREAESKIEVIFPAPLQGKIVGALLKAHPYEEVAYDIISLDNSHARVGSGMLGELAEEMNEMDFLLHLKKVMKANGIRYTKLRDKPIKKVAVCGGSGGFLLQNAIGARADIFVTADYKYHEFFDADGRIVIADIGHYESEQYTIDLFKEILSEKFSNFAVISTEINTNPINYL